MRIWVLGFLIFSDSHLDGHELYSSPFICLCSPSCVVQNLKCEQQPCPRCRSKSSRYQTQLLQAGPEQAKTLPNCEHELGRQMCLLYVSAYEIHSDIHKRTMGPWLAMEITTNRKHNCSNPARLRWQRSAHFP